MIYVSGVSRLPVARDLDRPLIDAYRTVAMAAVDDAGLTLADVDGLFVTPAAMSGEPWMMFAANLAAHLHLTTKRVGCYENGGCSSLVALGAAFDAVAAGACETALVLAGDTRLEPDLEAFEVFIHVAVQRQVGLHGASSALYGVGAPIPYYAMAQQRYMFEHGVDAESIARVPVVLRTHAARSTNAQFRDPITIDDVLASPLLSPPIHLLESSSLSAGVAGVVVTRERRARSVALLGAAEYHTPTHFVPPDQSLTTALAVARAGEAAYRAAGLGPGDIDVAEVYGAFAATELMLYEDLGFFERGRASIAVEEGHTTFGATTVFNPSGGRLSLGHPAAATPLYEVAEIVTQLRGEVGANQVEGASIGLVQAEHGMLNGSTVMIFGEG